MSLCCFPKRISSLLLLTWLREVLLLLDGVVSVIVLQVVSTLDGVDLFAVLQLPLDDLAILNLICEFAVSRLFKLNI